MNYDFKIGVFGGSGTEKTEITMKFLMDESNGNYIPRIDDEFSKIITVNNNTINLSIVDTAGQDDFSEMRYTLYSKIQGAILVFDISNPQTIDDIKRIYQDIKEAEVDNIIIAVAANRGYLRDENNNENDLIDVNRYDELEKFFNCKLFETNTKTGKNIHEIFSYIIKQFLTTMKKEKFPSDKKQRNVQILETSKTSISSNNLVKKRSTSFVPKLFGKRNINNSKTDGPRIEQSNSSPEVFASPMGAEIKTILQSRTKQLQLALEEKKELERKLAEKDEELKQKDDELQKAYDMIHQLEKELGRAPSNIEDSHRKKKKKSRKTDADADDEDRKEKKKSRKTDLDVDDEERREKKKSRKRTKTTGDNEKQKIDKFNEKDFSIQKVQLFKPIEMENFQKIKDLAKTTLYESSKVIVDTQEMTRIIFVKNPNQELFQQCEILNQLQHQNIIKFEGFCIGNKSDKSQILQEYFDNNLSTVINTLEKEDRITIIYEIVSALKEANEQRIHHLSLCADNIFIDESNHAKISDFSMLKNIFPEYSNCIEKIFPEKCHFMAPELFENNVENEEKVDVFSLGIIVYFILTKGEYPSMKNGKLDEENEFPDCINQYAKRLINLCLSSDHNNRPSLEDIMISLESDLDLIDGADITTIREKLQL